MIKYGNNVHESMDKHHTFMRINMSNYYYSVPTIVNHWLLTTVHELAANHSSTIDQQSWRIIFHFQSLRSTGQPNVGDNTQPWINVHMLVTTRKNAGWWWYRCCRIADTAIDNGRRCDWSFLIMVYLTIDTGQRIVITSAVIHDLMMIMNSKIVNSNVNQWWLLYHKFVNNGV